MKRIKIQTTKNLEALKALICEVGRDWKCFMRDLSCEDNERKLLAEKSMIFRGIDKKIIKELKNTSEKFVLGHSKNQILDELIKRKRNR